MKKMVQILIAVCIGAIGLLSAPVAHAQTPTPEECAEADTAPPGCPPDGNYPPVVLPPTAPPTTEPPATTTTTIVVVAPPQAPTGPLPSTGSSGVAPFLQIGALFLTGGLVVLVAARRRSTANAAA